MGEQRIWLTVMVVALLAWGAWPADGPGQQSAWGQSSGANFRIGGRSGPFRWGLGVSAAQGSSLSMTSQSPSITLPNGGTGFFINSFQRPFVTGIVPVVGTQSISPVRERWQRLQYERWQESRSPRASSPSPAEQPRPVERKVDDPPLILGGAE